MKHVIAMAAGGTGGHLFPAEALARELVARGHGAVIYTDARGARYTHAFEGLPHVVLPARSLARRQPSQRQATTRRVWVPSPSIPSRMTSPPFRNTLGFCPMPTPGGVPVVITSPGISVMKVEQ